MRKRRVLWNGVMILLCICLAAVALNIAYFSSAFASPVWSLMYSALDDLYGVWGSTSNDVFAVGNLGNIAHYNGSTWSQKTAGIEWDDLYGVAGGANLVIAVGLGGTIIYYLSGTAWEQMSSITTNDLYGVWGTADDLFAVGLGGTILHYSVYDGEWWSMSSPTANDLRGVWGSASDDVFAVGDSGIIVHYNGTEWSVMTSGTANDLRSVWGSAPDDVFAVGGAGTIVHYNGTEWSAMTSGTVNELDGVWGSGSNDVFAVGNAGTILHYDGTPWSAMSSGTTNYLYGVWGTASNDVFAVGQGGTILHYSEPTMPTPSPTGEGEGEAQVSATVTLQSISVTIAEGYPTAMDYGVMAPGTEAMPATYTPGTYSYLRVENQGSVAEDFLIKGADATCGAGTWTLAATPGADQYSHLYGIGQSPVSYTPLSTDASILGSNVAVGGTVDFNLKIKTPTSSTVYGEYSTTVTILAVAH